MRSGRKGQNKNVSKYNLKQGSISTDFLELGLKSTGVSFFLDLRRIGPCSPLQSNHSGPMETAGEGEYRGSVKSQVATVSLPTDHSLPAKKHKMTFLVPSLCSI